MRSGVGGNSIFLSGRAVWREITERIRQSRQVHAAISYVGQGASRIIPLRRNDVLVVDMSLRAVAQGVTDPRKIAKLTRTVLGRRDLRGARTKAKVANAVRTPEARPPDGAGSFSADAGAPRRCSLLGRTPDEIRRR